MRQLLPLVFLVGCSSLQAQIYLDSLPLNPLFNDTVISTPHISIGYGQQDLHSFNGAATHLEAGQFNQGQINEWNQLWQAQVPGFTLTRPGSDPNKVMDARIRGLRTLGYGSTQPLYVVDGVPGVDPFAVDPSDIVAVDVLRDAASTAIYGGRGAGGVVIITTKPTESGALKIQYQGQVSVESAASRYTVLNEDQFIGKGGTDFSPGYIANTDWQDQVLQTGVGHAHHLSVNKGWGQGFVRAGLHYRDVTGIIRETGFQQYNGSLLAGRRFWQNRLDLSAGASLGQRNAEYGFPEAYRYALSFNPSSPLHSDDPKYQPTGGYVEGGSLDLFNPLAIIEQNHNSGRIDFRMLHARAALLILRNLTASVQVSEQRNAVHNLEYYSPYSRYRGAGTLGRGIANAQKNWQKNLESTLNYRFQGGSWQGDLLGGYGWYHAQVNSSAVTGVKLGDATWAGKTWEQYRDLLQGLPGPGEERYNYDVQSDRQLIAFFGRAQVQWRNTYFGTFSWRKEGSSNLPSGNRWGVFPAFSLGVDINRWMPSRPFDYLKFSFGHGVTGTEPTRSGLYQGVFDKAFGNVNYYYNGQYLPAYALSQNRNDQLGWERTTENSLNLQFSLHDGRLQGGAMLYRYHSRDLMIAVTKDLPPNFARTTIENVGAISGRGAELSLHYQLAKNQNLTWEVGISATTATSELDHLVSPVEDTLRHTIPGFPCGCDTYLQLLYPGATIGTFWGPVAGTVSADGVQTFEDLDGNGVVQQDQYNRDQTYLGHAQPKWQLGISQKLIWRNWDLNFLLQAVTGHHLVNYYRYADEATFIGYNQIVTQYYDPAVNYTQFNSRYVEKASFLRMQYLSLGYRLPLNRKWINSLHFQIGAQNLFTFSNYSGSDPDLQLRDTGNVNDGGRPYSGYGDVLAPGVDRGTTHPLARRWWLGVEAAF